MATAETPKPIRAIVLTSTFLRHQYVVKVVASKLDLAGVWQEAKQFQPLTYARDAGEASVIERHFAARDESEARFFTGQEALRRSPSAVHRTVPIGGCNDAREVSEMRALSPDVVLVFGTGILREPLLSAFAGRIINLHLGLSPYYRGAGTNFWPLVNREPEYVGATVHYLDAGVDTGPVIAHVRPEIALGDGPHDLGNKTIVAAAATLVDAATAHVRGLVGATPQTGSGRVYRRKDFNAEAVRTLYRQFETGMIAEYLSQKPERDARLSLIALETVV